MSSTAYEQRPVINPVAAASSPSHMSKQQQPSEVSAINSTPSSANLFDSKPAKQGAPPNLQAPMLTGAAALADTERSKEAAKEARKTPGGSPNPATTVVKALMSGQDQAMSKPVEAPAQPVTRITGTDGTQLPITDEPMQIDQEPAPSQNNVDGVHDPQLMRTDLNNESNHATPGTRQEERSNKAFTYPPRPDQLEEVRTTPARGMSLPSANSKSPGSKKHRCQHCGTEFTRHHNLKSHLLTHSQEKPFECDRCDQKFRRLHDLKRHTKLHTGERPHTCQKCGRAFARGDALARHNKGPGGCAGRRGSGGEEDFEGGSFDDGMEGVVYNDQGEEVQNSKRRKSEQTHSRKRSFQSTVDSSPYRHHSSTYPGVAPMQGVQPPAQVNGPSHPNHLSPRITGGQSQFPSQLAVQSVFSQSGMTESPKPLSPGAEAGRRLSAGLPYPGRAKSPSFSQQHPLGRNTGHNSPSGMAIPTAPMQQPVLPSVGNLASDSQRSSLPSSTHSTSGPFMGRPPPSISTAPVLSHPGPSSAGSTNPPSASSQHRSSGGSMREILNPGPNEDRTPQEFIRKADADAQIRRIQDDNYAQLQQLRSVIQSLQDENSKLKAAQQNRPPLQVTQPENLSQSH